MNNHPKPIYDVSCFTIDINTSMEENSFEETEFQKDHKRKLSFRENFDLYNPSPSNPTDLLADFFSRRRKLTNEMLDLDEAKRASLILDSEPMEQDYEPSLPSTQPNSQISAFMVSQQNSDLETYPNFPMSNPLNTAPSGMEEEYEDVPFIEEFETGNSLMERVYNDNGITPLKENINTGNRGLDLQTSFGFYGKGESPTSCLLKPSQSNPGFSSQENDGMFQSPAKRYNNSSLATCKNMMNPDLRAITPETLVELMTSPEEKKFLVIDCRYEYEYIGGHIKGAINITNPEFLEEVLIRNRDLLCKEDTLEQIKRDCKGTIAGARYRTFKLQERMQELTPPILVFHCEFSQKRGPRALKALRNLDQTVNHINWPNFYYPEVYILDNGYKNFHSKFPHFCDPENMYVRMLDKAYKAHYVEAKMNDRKHWKTKETQEPTSLLVLQRNKTMTYI